MHEDVVPTRIEKWNVCEKLWGGVWNEQCGWMIAWKVPGIEEMLSKQKRRRF